VKSLELKIPPLLLMLLFAVLMFCLSPILPKVTMPPVIHYLLSLAVFIVATYFIVFGVLVFKKASTTVDPRYPERVTNLVNNGVYSISRNPMYVGFALLLMSLVILLGSPLLVVAIVAFICYMNRFQIKPEEDALSELFGSAYKEYTSRVRRWL
jgi:protein-S-isoprenylcysteine O-methyltransferase Ste14